MIYLQLKKRKLKEDSLFSLFFLPVLALQADGFARNGAKMEETSLIVEIVPELSHLLATKVVQAFDLACDNGLLAIGQKGRNLEAVDRLF